VPKIKQKLSALLHAVKQILQSMRILLLHQGRYFIRLSDVSRLFWETQMQHYLRH